MALDFYLILGYRQSLTSRYVQLFLDDVKAGDHFGNRVLNLNAGVHFNEIKFTFFI